MAHTIRDKQKLINRVRRIRGQLDAAEGAIEKELDCTVIMHTLAAGRGALDSLMAEVMEGHIKLHLVDPDDHPTSVQAKAAQDLIDVIKTYLT
ncbi:MAG: metal/formaldehyde-sensitive transcriptional repressor [Candidatus Binatus sp.]|jgi:DNA-binding FrmR family transcriptional regulator